MSYVAVGTKCHDMIDSVALERERRYIDRLGLLTIGQFEGQLPHCSWSIPGLPHIAVSSGVVSNIVRVGRSVSWLGLGWTALDIKTSVRDHGTVDKGTRYFPKK